MKFKISLLGTIFISLFITNANASDKELATKVIRMQSPPYWRSSRRPKFQTGVVINILRCSSVEFMDYQA